MGDRYSPGIHPKTFSHRNFSGSSGERLEAQGLQYGNSTTQIPRAGFSPTRVTLTRTISSANLDLTDRFKNLVQGDLVRNPPEGGTIYFSATPKFTLTLPCLDSHSGLKNMVYAELVDNSVQRSLEGERVINWCNLLTPVFPLHIISDGNSLLHAASLGMWGFQDRQHVLRQALHDALNCQTRNSLYDRWKYSRENIYEKNGLKLEPHSWERNWQMIIHGQNRDGMDDFHVFVLANVLRRPIIIYASSQKKSHQRESFHELNFEGVYLPLLWYSTRCIKNPLPLAYSSGHFSPLTVVGSPDLYRNSHMVFPLVDWNINQLPIKFTHPVEQNHTLCMEYLDMIDVKTPEASPVQPIRCCKLTTLNSPDDFVMTLTTAFVNECSAEFEKGNSVKHALESPSSSHGRPQGENMLQSDSRKVIQAESAGRKLPVKCSECSEPGFAALLGKCRACYDRSQSSDVHKPPPFSGGSKISNQPLLQTLPLTTSERRECRKEGCDFYGDKELRFYCSRCFKNDMERILKEADEGLPIPGAFSPPGSSQAHINPGKGGPSASPAVNNPPKCLNCNDFYANIEYNGFCHKCFIRSTLLPTNPSSLSSDAHGPGILTEPQHHIAEGASGGGVREKGPLTGRDGGPCDNKTQFYPLQYHPPLPHRPAYTQPQHRDNTTTQVGNISLQMQGMKLGGVECIVCRGEDNLDNLEGEAFVFCRRHAIEAIRGNPRRGRGEELPAPVDLRETAQYSPLSDPSRLDQLRHAGDFSPLKPHVSNYMQGSISGEHRKIGGDHGRISNEHERVSYEYGMIGGDQGRIGGVLGRIDSDQGRINSELGRIGGDHGWIGGDQGRIGGDHRRISGDLGRIGGDQGRIGGDQGRIDSELGRIGGDHGWIGGDQGRVGDDRRRIGGDHGRIGGDHGRIGGDHRRISDDLGRIGGDHGRIGGDHGRIGGDHRRISDDLGRIGGDHGRIGDDQGRIGGDQGRIGDDHRWIGGDHGRIGGDHGRIGGDHGWIGGDQGKIGGGDQGRAGGEHGGIGSEHRRISDEHRIGSEQENISGKQGKIGSEQGRVSTDTEAGGASAKVYVSEKTLCRIAGCLYKPYQELDNFCPEDYEAAHDTLVDRIKFPEVYT